MDADATIAVLRALFAESPTAVGMTDEKASIVMANPALLRILGYDDESEVLGRSLMELIVAPGQELTAEMMRRHAMGEQVPVLEVHHRTRDGREVTLEVRNAPTMMDGQRYSFGLLREVEPTKRARSQRGDDFYRALFDVNTAVKLLIEPTTGRIVDANQAAVELYGWSLEELLQMRITDINTLTPDEVEEEMDNARTGRRRYFRFRHRTARGEVRHVEVHSGPVSLDGELLLLSIVHDVTERDALEELLKRSQRLETVGRIAGGIAHDFNNLITVMIGTSEMLLRRTEHDPELKPHLKDLAHAAHRASDLTRDLLAFSRRQVVEPRPLRVDALVTRMVGLLRRTIGTEYTIHCTVADDAPVVRADAAQLEQVVMNLAINARDAMPGGGELRIGVHPTDVRPGDTRGVPTGRWVAIEVADEGEGMDEETRGRVFEPFFTTKHGTGSGLGLATVHGIVTQAGGHVTVSSEPGRGSVFTVYLPPAPPDDAAHDDEAPSTAVRPQGGRVLLVDDMPEVLSTLERGLRCAGFEVTTARSADEAASRSDEELRGLDVVVSDVVMPGRSGVSLAEEIARRVPELPILLVSGEVQEHRPETFPAGVQFLAKPFTTRRLAEAIHNVIAAHSSSSGAPPG